MVNLLIGIVTYKSRDTIAQCLNTVIASAKDIDHKICIYDNASFDGTAQVISQHFANVNLISSSENYGYARGVNEISRICGWDYFLVLNPDVIVDESAIPIALECIKSRQDIAVLGANLVDSNNNPVHSYGDLPTPSMFKYDFSGLRKWFPQRNWTSTKKVTTEKEPFQVGYVTGAFMLINRIAWDSNGPMDDRYFLFFEDTDWAYRLKKGNRKSFVHPSVKAIHESGKSFGEDDDSREYKMKCYFEGAYKYFGKHFGEVDRDITFDRVVNYAKIKLFMMKMKGEDKSDAGNRQKMIIKIHRELARDVFRR